MPKGTLNPGKKKPQRRKKDFHVARGSNKTSRGKLPIKFKKIVEPRRQKKKAEP